MSYLDASMPPGEWHTNDFRVGDRIYVDYGSDVIRRCTVTGNNKFDYTDLELTVKWDDNDGVPVVFPNMQWVGLLPKEADDGTS